MINKIKNMKKIFSMILCITMLTTLLTGCGVSEMGYMNTISEMIALKTFSFSGDYNLNVPETIKLNVNGNVDISNTENMYLDATVNFEYPEEDIYLTDAEILFTNNQLYLEKDLVRQLLAVEENEGYMKSFDEELANIEYISINTEDFSVDEAPIQNTIKSTNKIPEILKEIFNGLETGAISKTNSGYVVEISDKNLVSIIDKFVDFIDTNKENLYNAVINAIDKNYDAFKTADLPDKEEVLSEITTTYNKETVMSEISETIKTYRESFREEIIASLEEYKGSGYTQTLFKNQSKYTIKEDVVFNYPVYDYFAIETNELDVVRTETFKFKGLTEIEAIKTVQRKEFNSTNVLDIEIAEENVDLKYKKTYPVVSAEIRWTDVEMGAEIYTVNAEHENGYEFYDLYMKDDRIYLPLRKTAELFGETVEWDAENSKAYVVRDNEKIDMTGIIIEDRTMIKVRDFEKLGYRIDYNFNGYENIAIINK